MQDINNLSKALLEKEKIVPQALNGMLTYDVIDEKLEKSGKTILYLDKQDVVTKKQTEKYTFEYREINYYKAK